MEKGLKNLQNIIRRERSTKRTLPDPETLSEPFPHHDPFSHRSRSHSVEENLDDSSMVANLSNSPFAPVQAPIGGNDDQNQGIHSAGDLTSSSPRRSFTPNRTSFSNSTSSLSFPGSTPTMTAPPQFSLPINSSPVAISSPQPPLAVPNRGSDYPQQLPSFRVAFSDMPSVIASNLSKHAPNRAPVTTH